MECQDALDLLHEIIDKEASEIDTARVKEHLENCRDCFKKFKIEESVQAFLDEKIKTKNNEQSGSENLESLKMRIFDKLDEIDLEDGCSHGNNNGFFNLSGRTIMAAASLILLVAASYFTAGYIRHYNTYVPLEDSHINAVAHAEYFNDTQVTTTMINSMASDYHYQTTDNLNDYKLIGGRVEEIDGVKMNHLMYSNGTDEPVSLFVVPADKFSIPEKLKNNKFVLGSGYYYLHHCHGCNLAYFKSGSLIFITASTDKTLELSRFIPPNVI